MNILLIAGQSGGSFFKRKFRQKRDAVEGLLAMGDDVVAERLDRFAGKCLIDAFDLLQADDIRRAVLEPGQEMIEPLSDRIDVPGRYAHGRFQCLSPRAYHDQPGIDKQPRTCG